MRLVDLIAGLEVQQAPSDAVVKGIAFDSRAVEPGFLFAAMPGEHVDGHAFIKNAVERGASAILAERPAQGVTVPQVIVPDVKDALSRVSAVFYGEPSKSLTLIGITGTNGKTTTTFLLESILREAGARPGVIGTVNYRFAGKLFPAPHTTPQAPELQKILREMADNGVTHCVMEVSSHALEQKRAGACLFKAGVFTNLTRDHLDYHQTMEEYFRCKSLLFKFVDEAGGRSVVNIDDPWGRKLKELFPSSYTYSLKAGADIFPKEFSLLDGTTEALITTPFGEVRVSSHLVGEYNLQNILGAVGIAGALGVDAAVIAMGVNNLERVPGRLEKTESVSGKRLRAYVDYAHTGDALERALEALKKVSTGRIITVFGCGGNRDRGKRPLMGGISARLSDITIVTSDNPRDEDPMEIIKEVEAGLKGVGKHGPHEDFDSGYTLIPDRHEAIRKAVSLARDGDTILLAGKGHEDYQIVKGVRHHFDDSEEIASAIRELCVEKDAV